MAQERVALALGTDGKERLDRVSQLRCHLHLIEAVSSAHGSSQLVRRKACAGSKAVAA